MNGWLGIRYGKQCKNIYTEDGVQRSLKVTLWRQSRNNEGRKYKTTNDKIK